MKLQLSLALASNPRSWPILDGTVQPDGIELVPTVAASVRAVLAAASLRRFRRLGNVVLVADDGARGRRRALGRAADLHHAALLPYRHSGAARRKDRNAGRPAGQARRRAGISADRGVVDARRAAARVRRRRRPRWNSGWSGCRRTATPARVGFKPPPGVTIKQIPPEKNIGAMMLSGELDAALHYLSHRNLVDRSRVDLDNHPDDQDRCSPTRSPKACAISEDRHLSDQPRHGGAARDRREAPLGGAQPTQGVRGRQRDRQQAAHGACRIPPRRPG